MNKYTPLAINLSLLFLVASCTTATAPATATEPPPTPRPSTSTPTPSPTPVPTSTPTPVPPTITPTPTSFPPFRDDFEGELAPGWSWLREEPTRWSLTAKPGYLRLILSIRGLIDPPENYLLREPPKGNFEIETKVLFTPYSNFQAAGVLIFNDDANMLLSHRGMCWYEGESGACIGNGIYFDLLRPDLEYGSTYSIKTESDSDAYLRITRQANTYTAFYSEDGLTWTIIGIHEFDLEPLFVGIRAGNSQYPINADFDYFSMIAIP